MATKPETRGKELLMKPTINIVCVKADALTVSAQAEGWDNAYAMVARWIADPFYDASNARIERIYMAEAADPKPGFSNVTRLREYTTEDFQALRSTNTE